MIRVKFLKVVLPTALTGESICGLDWFLGGLKDRLGNRLNSTLRHLFSGTLFPVACRTITTWLLIALKLPLN